MENTHHMYWSISGNSPQLDTINSLQIWFRRIRIENEESLVQFDVELTAGALNVYDSTDNE